MEILYTFIIVFFYHSENSENGKEERFLTSCDLTVTNSVPTRCMKGCIIKNSTVLEGREHLDYPLNDLGTPKWRKLFLCCSCPSFCNDILWKLSVRCVKHSPRFCNGANVWCIHLDKVGKKGVVV